MDMPLLTELWFVHYSPKDAKRGLAKLIISDNEDQVLE